MDQHLCRRQWRRPGLRLIATLGGLLGLAVAVPAAPGEQALELDADRSSIEVLVQASFGSFTGKLPHYEADIRVDAAHQVIGRAVVNFTFADLRTGIALRDRHMREWEDSVRFPNVSFHMGSIETTPDNRTLVHGGLVLHGIEHAVSFPVSLLVAGPVYSVDGEVEIDYRDFGLAPIHRFWVLVVEPRMIVRFHLQGRLAAEPAAI
jgi:polyisoprenoid-binding protein YceI